MNRLWKRISVLFEREDTEVPVDESIMRRVDPAAFAVLSALENEGKDAFLVGGCVRDLLMGKEPHDWDITTSARPEEILHTAAQKGWKAVDGGGRRFGTVILSFDGKAFEVTAYRKEFYGEDAHRPERVSFADSLEEDLQRRDFTVNAMALSAGGILVDLFGGRKAIRKKMLYTVGPAAERFSEDALRLFRACRFLGQLDFLADASLVEGMASAFSRVSGLSLERVREELDKLIVTPHAGRGFDLMVRSGLAAQSCRVKENGVYEEIPILPELAHLVGLPQQKEFHKFDGWYHTLAVLEAASPVVLNRWAALLHDVGKGMPGIRAVRKGKLTDYGHDLKGADMAEEILSRHRRSPAFVSRVKWIVANHMKYHYYANVQEAVAIRWIRRMAREKVFASQAEMAKAMEQITDVCIADIVGCGKPYSAAEGHAAFGEYMKELALSMPVTAKELHYDRRVPEVLGTWVKDGMNNLLLRVQTGSLENEPDALYEAACRFKKRKEKE